MYFYLEFQIWVLFFCLGGVLAFDGKQEIVAACRGSSVGLVNLPMTL
jgi:hypothetical protein